MIIEGRGRPRSNSTHHCLAARARGGGAGSDQNQKKKNEKNSNSEHARQTTTRVARRYIMSIVNMIAALLKIMSVIMLHSDVQAHQ